MFDIFYYANLCFSPHKKASPERQQQQSKSSWRLSGLPWHIKHKGFLVMEYLLIFLICRPQLVYCMCFTTMEHSYSYHELNPGCYRFSWWPIWSSVLSKPRPEKRVGQHSLFANIEVGLTLLAGMNWNSHALGTKNWQGLAPNLVECRIEVES